jgi:hypothetical protein
VGQVQFIDAHRKIRVAEKPSAVRPACSLAHFSIKTRLSGPAFAGSVAMSISFVGIPRQGACKVVEMSGMDLAKIAGNLAQTSPGALAYLYVARWTPVVSAIGLKID